MSEKNGSRISLIAIRARERERERERERGYERVRLKVRSVCGLVCKNG